MQVEGIVFLGMESSEDSEHAKIQSLLEKIWWTIMYCEIKNYNCKNSNKIISKRSKVHAHLATCNKLSVIVKTKVSENPPNVVWHSRARCSAGCF
jgi:hypothetical protein